MRHVLPLIQAAHDLHSVALATVSGCGDGPSRVAIATARHARRGNLIESCNRRRHWGMVIEGRKAEGDRGGKDEGKGRRKKRRREKAEGEEEDEARRMDVVIERRSG